MRAPPLLLAAAVAAAGVATAAADSALTVNSAWAFDASVAPFLKGDFVALVPNPISLALRDLKADWYKVLGTAPTVVSSAAPAAWDGDAIVVFKLDAAALPPEAFTVVAGAGGAAPTLTVTGGDVRGLIYGIYHVSSDFLGVDPFWWWNDAPPTYEPAGVAVDPSYTYASGAPAFRSRGGFNNDEDLSGYFAASPLGDAVYGTAWADRMCETLLRLRVNTLIPSTFAFVDESPYRVAAARGLKLGNHHVMPVGNNVFAWPKGVSYAYRLNPGPFHTVWEQLAAYQQQEQGREMVYSLGYRGINDECVAVVVPWGWFAGWRRGCPRAHTKSAPTHPTPTAGLSGTWTRGARRTRAAAPPSPPPSPTSRRSCWARRRRTARRSWWRTRGWSCWS
jgi:hypothetical protein